MTMPTSTFRGAPTGVKAETARCPDCNGPLLYVPHSRRPREYRGRAMGFCRLHDRWFDHSEILSLDK